MEQRMTLGKTALNVSRLGFGGIPIQRVDEDTAVKTVLHAVEHGVDFIDTARAYTTSEARIGAALRRTDKRVIVASKSRQQTADGIVADIEKSRSDLQRDYIDLYQCHFVKDNDAYERVISPGGAREGLEKARDRGIIGHIGITSHSLDVLDRALDDGFFETIMVCYSFLEPKAGKTVIPKALARNIGVIVMKSFAGGVIENASLALKYGLSFRGTALIPGVESIEKFDENRAVFLGNTSLTQADQDEIDEITRQFDRQFCRRCDYCQPCPEGIPIQIVLGIKSMVKRMGTSILIDGWRKEAIEKSRNCTECGTCLERCPYELPIPALLKENVAWTESLLESGDVS